MQGASFNRESSSLSSERNRSNSEGGIQSSLSVRNRRMGLVGKKNTDLGTLEEVTPYGNKHVRGRSYGSVLRTQFNTVSGEDGFSYPSSPKERKTYKNGPSRHLTSLPEQKIARRVRDPITQGARGVLFSLSQVHHHISSLISILGSQEQRKNNSLEIVFYNASTHLCQLNTALESVELIDWQDPEAIKRSSDCVKRECKTCIIAYIHVGSQLRLNIHRVVSHAERKYIRSMLLMIFGSLVELRNACFVLEFRPWLSKLKKRNEYSELDSQRDYNTKDVTGIVPTFPDQPLTSLRENLTDTTDLVTLSQDPASTNLLSTATPDMKSNQDDETRSRLVRTSCRSRPTMVNLTNDTMPEDQFEPVLASALGYLNPITGLNEIEEERLFEKIFIQLNHAQIMSLQAVPTILRFFSLHMQSAEEKRLPDEIRVMWTKLTNRSRTFIDVSEALRNRLASMKVQSLGPETQNQCEFWQLCKSFIQSFVTLVTEMREAKSMHLLSPDVVKILRPVQHACRDVGRMIDTSPWSCFVELSSVNGPGLNSQVQSFQSHHHPGSSSHLQGAMTETIQPSVPLAATPLSAALGPAAQATVPIAQKPSYGEQLV